MGRVLPQLAYSAHAALKLYAETGTKAGFIIPTGNLGHGFAVLLAKALGLPIGPVVLATNANRTLKDWHASGLYEPRASEPTLASAMDVGNPSNFERLAILPQAARSARVELVSDEQIRARIRAGHDAFGYVWCPHSATGAKAWSRSCNLERAELPWIVAATAHPHKFADIVEPLIGCRVEASLALAAIADRPSRKLQISANLGDLVSAPGEKPLAA
jgi:threonine synthase